MREIRPLTRPSRARPLLPFPLVAERGVRRRPRRRPPPARLDVARAPRRRAGRPPRLVAARRHRETPADGRLRPRLPRRRPGPAGNRDPAGRRGHPAAVPALRAASTGATTTRPGWRPWRRPAPAPLVERLRLEWRPGTPVAATTLEFREPAGREELVGLMTRVTEASLDAHTLLELRTMTPREQAESQYEEELALYSSPREWWRVGIVGGEPVGFVIPARNAYNLIIAYIGVVPEHRGKRLVGELLAEGTRILAAQDVPRIRAGHRRHQRPDGPRLRQSGLPHHRAPGRHDRGRSHCESGTRSAAGRPRPASGICPDEQRVSGAVLTR